MKRLACVLLFAAVGSGVAEVIDLGTRRELFVDRFLIEKLDGAQLRLHEPHRDGMALQFDKPWEGGFSAYITVIKDGALYRMYYRGLPMAAKDGSPEALVCYAESKDGLAWTKPDLGLFEIRGTRQNNVVLTNAPFTHNFSPFLDDRPDAPASEKYKALGGTYVTGLHAFKSADGIHWSELQSGAVFTNGVFDSQNVSFWSVAEQQYICLDGFISVNAPYSGGELLTKPFKSPATNWKSVLPRARRAGCASNCRTKMASRFPATRWRKVPKSSVTKSGAWCRGPVERTSTSWRARPSGCAS